ncbi:hypothetical protein [Cellulomonas sp.]|uniref:hypothetical protein n=1 Tax=Cellulomonas sp. TaxID=40001 RepID=UPI003BAA8CD4
MLDALPKIRAVLVGVAKAGTTITHGDLMNQTGKPYAPNGVGKALDALSQDCLNRDEPSLAALVVTAQEGEVGSAFSGDAPAERRLCYRHWSQRRSV